MRRQSRDLCCVSAAAGLLVLLWLAGESGLRVNDTPSIPLGLYRTTGEAVMLSDHERHEVLRVTAEVASPEKVLIAGTGAESVIETLRLTELATSITGLSA